MALSMSKLGVLLFVNGLSTCFCTRFESRDDSPEEEPYKNLPREWQKASFDERWSMFRHAVPLEILQGFTHPSDPMPVCQPTLQFPVTCRGATSTTECSSNKLAILIHGFTGCPIHWYLQAAELLQEGFMVLRPTLPGHGRKWTRKRVKSCNVTEVTGDVNAEACKESQIEDDLAGFPSSPQAFWDFAEALGDMAEQFKAEHPGGTVVIAGHSLGGLTSFATVLRHPQAFDRQLLLNPIFGFGTKSLVPFIKLASPVRVSFDWDSKKDCEGHTRKHGGYCQFYAGNVATFISWAGEVYKKGMKKKALALFPDTQALVSIGDNLVDNSRTETLINKIKQDRSLLHQDTVGGMTCVLPKQLGHSYQFPLSDAARDFWWLPYVQERFKRFLVSGDFFKVSSWERPGACSMKEKCGMCFTNKRDIQNGKELAVLPALTSHQMERQISGDWIVISNTLACESNGDGVTRMQSLGRNHTLEDCEKACNKTWPRKEVRYAKDARTEGDGKCRAIDFYRSSGWCNLYDYACEKPTRSLHGSSSLKMITQPLTYSLAGLHSQLVKTATVLFRGQIDTYREMCGAYGCYHFSYEEWAEALVMKGHLYWVDRGPRSAQETFDAGNVRAVYKVIGAPQRVLPTATDFSSKRRTDCLLLSWQEVSGYLADGQRSNSPGNEIVPQIEKKKVCGEHLLPALCSSEGVCGVVDEQSLQPERLEDIHNLPFMPLVRRIY
eukprot:TRINITY_DN15173_c0_g1_i2.p1 TRINITY_DN15173_c0_g1~~TRINITY_DN15173_c0_g1_i2.p1  ORF type:complete len:722 (-),score=62.29 TRINITY_DN15173_c0_g1_i2:158-2323(-)